MTKSWQSAHDPLADEVRREAQRTGIDPCKILKDRRLKARQARDTEELQRIKRAEKFLGCRNRRKRGKRRS